MSTIKVENLTNIGSIAVADKLVGERVDGTTVRIQYSDVGTTDRTTVGTLTTGTWNATTIATGYGGTGLASYTSNSILYASNSSTIAQITAVNNAVLSYNGSGVPSASTTLPSGLTIPGYQTTLTPAALTRVSDTNVTLTLGGTPSTSLLQATSITVGWSGQLALTRGGTAASLTADNGGIVYSTSSALGILASTATANKMLLSGSSTTPSWSTSTIPSSAGATSGKVLLSDGTNYVLSTPTFPNASATSGKIIKSDGTNWIASTETYAVPGTSGNIMQSNGTNWTSATPTGSGTPVLATSPTLVTPLLGTPTSGNLSNCTNYPLAQLTGAGTGVLTFLATPSSSNLAAAVTDETGSGALVFATSPTLVTPSLGVATGTSFNSITGLAAQSDQETATSTVLAVSPGRQQFHPSAVKVWAYITVSAGTPTLAASYNVTSITDGGVGVVTVTIATDISSANYAITNGSSLVGSTVSNITYVSARAATDFTASHYENATLTDPTTWDFSAFGDL